MLHSPELMLLLHNVDRAELYAELRGRARGVRPGLARGASTAMLRYVAARAALARSSRRPTIAPEYAGCCAA